MTSTTRLEGNQIDPARPRRIFPVRRAEDAPSTDNFDPESWVMTTPELAARDGCANHNMPPLLSPPCLMTNEPSPVTFPAVTSIYQARPRRIFPVHRAGDAASTDNFDPESWVMTSPELAARDDCGNYNTPPPLPQPWLMTKEASPVLDHPSSPEQPPWQLKIMGKRPHNLPSLPQPRGPSHRRALRREGSWSLENLGNPWFCYRRILLPFLLSLLLMFFSENHLSPRDITAVAQNCTCDPSVDILANTLEFNHSSPQSTELPEPEQPEPEQPVATAGGGILDWIDHTLGWKEITQWFGFWAAFFFIE